LIKWYCSVFCNALWKQLWEWMELDIFVLHSLAHNAIVVVLKKNDALVTAAACLHSQLFNAVVSIFLRSQLFILLLTRGACFRLVLHCAYLAQSWVLLWRCKLKQQIAGKLCGNQNLFIQITCKPHILLKHTQFLENKCNEKRASDLLRFLTKSVCFSD